jgi:threonine 3-dehydrogenase
MSSNGILVIGANGQIGTVLTSALRTKYGSENVLATDIRESANSDGPFQILDISDRSALEKILTERKIDQIYHLAAILSAKGEANPVSTWEFNMDTLLNVLECARLFNVKKVFYPSSIAVFGGQVNRAFTAQHSPLYPTTVYGISKAAGENWALYYWTRYGLDVRSIRYPGIIGYQSLPGGGTTDYAVDIYHKAINGQEFECFLEPETRLPMIYMEDAIRATIELMDVPSENIKLRTSYNLAGMSFSPAEIYESVKSHFPDFKIRYQPDFRQRIAESWPEVIDDSAAKQDWGWNPKFDLSGMTADMVLNLKK